MSSSEPVIQWIPPQYAYEPNVPGYDPPPDPTVSIWRYMDFTKFVSMLETSSLYFSRVDRLGDPFEGSLTRSEAESRAAFEGKLRQSGRPVGLYNLSQGKVRSEVRNTIVSCWHMNEVESMAMWRLYLTGREGIAVRSTYQNLLASFTPFDGNSKGMNADMTDRELRIRVGVVHYVDYEGDLPRRVPRILLKRQSFAHERELRAVAMDQSWGNSPQFDQTGEPLTRFASGGDQVKVDLKDLITEVLIVPQAQSWFAELVTAVIRRYGFSFKVTQSDLDRDPVF